MGKRRTPIVSGGEPRTLHGRTVTGRGTRSEGPEVMRGLVLDALRDTWANVVEDWGVDTGGGAYLIQLRS